MHRTNAASLDDAMFQWEADEAEMFAHVSRRLAARPGEAAEPSWFPSMFDASWPMVFADADADAWRV
jgi:hypothetical protein